jgi:nicotinate-nucleotide pyrophosphorylase (carboxylating)
VKLFQSQISRLSVKNPEYRKFVTDFLELLFRQDVGKGDKTAALLANPKKIIKAEIRAKGRGVLAGIEEAEFFLKKKGVQILKKKKDGAAVKKNDIVLILQASAKKILTLERVVLNLIQRMSGIATAADKLARKIGKQKFSATRKTPFGLLDTKAVVAGGGLPHRLNLADMILVKENHLAVDSSCWKKISTKEFFEIEADSQKLAAQVATHFAKAKNLVLLLDNFTPAQLRKLVPRLKKINPKIILEASGGITSKSAQKYLKAGADYVSLGEITHSAKVVDFTLGTY